MFIYVLVSSSARVILIGGAMFTANSACSPLLFYSPSSNPHLRRAHGRSRVRNIFCGISPHCNTSTIISRDFACCQEQDSLIYPIYRVFVISHMDQEKSKLLSLEILAMCNLFGKQIV